MNKTLPSDTKISKLVCALLLGIAVSSQTQTLPQVSPEQAGLSQERLNRIRPAMERDIAEGEMAGAVGLIARHGKIAYFETYGMADREGNRPMTKDAIFRMYSMTKAVVAVSVMTLYEEGRFNLRDPISKFLPEFKNMKVAVERTDPATGKRVYYTVPAEHDITILDLMRHTSGLNYAGPLDENGEAIYKQVLGDMQCRSANSSGVWPPHAWFTNPARFGITVIRLMSWPGW